MSMPSTIATGAFDRGQPGPLAALRRAFPDIEVTQRHTTIRRITPEIAKELLDRCNLRNRGMRRPHRDRLIEEMLEGRWKAVGESIKFSATGLLLDGQHRLAALVAAKVAVAFDVTFGLDEEDYELIDRGAMRSTADDLTVMSETFTVRLAAALGLQWLYENGSLQQIGAKIPAHALKEVLARNPGLRDSIRSNSAKRGLTSYLTPRICDFLHYQFSLRDPEAAEHYFADLLQGSGMSKGDPVLRLRDRMIQDKSSKSRLPPREILALAIKAWNGRRAGIECTFLRWSAGGDKPEAFPSIAD